MYGWDLYGSSMDDVLDYMGTILVYRMVLRRLEVVDVLHNGRQISQYMHQDRNDLGRSIRKIEKIEAVDLC